MVKFMPGKKVKRTNAKTKQSPSRIVKLKGRHAPSGNLSAPFEKRTKKGGLKKAKAA
jgi:hypothetical protein